MSVEKALGFIQKINDDEMLKKMIKEKCRTVSLKDISDMGKKEGFEFTEEEFQQAFSRDWVMRYIYYGSKS